MENRVLITGAKGFIGSHIKEALPLADTIDLKDGQDLRTTELGEYDVIFHVAADASIPKSFNDPIGSHENNVLGTLRILEHARKTGAKVVFSSSSSVNEMMSPYAIQKKQCEDYLKWYWTQGVKSVALRYYNVYGEGQEIANGGNVLVLSQLLNMYRNNEPWSIVEGGNRRRDFVYVKDVVRANLMAAEWLDTATEFKAFEVGTGMNHSIKEITEMLDPNREVISLPPRQEPLENRANPDQFLPRWQPTIKLPEWLNGIK